MHSFLQLIYTWATIASIPIILVGILLVWHKAKETKNSNLLALTVSLPLSVLTFLIGLWGFHIFFIDGPPSFMFIVMLSVYFSFAFFLFLWAISVIIIRFRTKEHPALLILAIFILVGFSLVLIFIKGQEKIQAELQTLKTPEGIIAAYEELTQNLPSFDYKSICSIAGNPKTPDEVLLKIIDLDEYNEGDSDKIDWCIIYPRIQNDKVGIKKLSDEVLIKIVNKYPKDANPASKYHSKNELNVRGVSF